MAFRPAVVTEILASSRPDLVRARIRFDDPDDATAAGGVDRAHGLTAVIGPVEVGDAVVCNTTAVELGLGSGGWHTIHWNLSRSRHVAPGPGHIMKLRYTGAQIDTGSVEEHHTESLATLPDLAATPVVVCTVHSQVAAVVAAISAISADGPRRRVALVLTDGAALPAALSDLVVTLRRRHLVDVTYSAGQAFGAEREAVTVPSAVAAAVVVDDAEVVVVAPGPGVVGTGTALGHTAIDAVGTLDAVAALGGRPIAVVRASSGDPRPRHRGLSHHSTTMWRLAGRRWDLWVPEGGGDATACDRLHTEVTAASAACHAPHRVTAIATPDPAEALADAELTTTTMGRLPVDDRLFFAAAWAAGRGACENSPALPWPR